jgi:predicted metal-dependent peptidase
MALSEEKIKKYIQRLLLSRMRILCNHGFYGLLLMHMVYSIDENLDTAGTDGMRITFGPDFLDSLTDSELDFVMMHEILHVVLQHCLREDNREHEEFNIACDIVVNSNILLENNMSRNSITLKKYGESMHIAPDGKEGYEYTAEQVYNMLPKMKKRKGPSNDSGVATGRAKQKISDEDHKPVWRWDDHSRWGMYEEDATLRDVWVKRFEDAAEAISIRDPSNTRGLMPRFAKRILEELRKPQTDWRIVLNDFIQEEVVDYSFSPPDRRFDDSPFFLPDFNGKDDMVENILFMIDTSGSMSDKMITAAYSEIKGAIDQFDGKLSGWLGFFDAAIIEPKPFANEEEFKIIRPAGGGGTDFQIIFEYVHKHMSDKPPASIIILTDGFAPFPQEKLAGGIPVLWLLNNDTVDPPWGKVARIKV